MTPTTPNSIPRLRPGVALAGSSLRGLLEGLVVEVKPGRWLVLRIDLRPSRWGVAGTREAVPFERVFEVAERLFDRYEWREEADVAGARERAEALREYLQAAYEEAGSA